MEIGIERHFNADLHQGYPLPLEEQAKAFTKHANDSDLKVGLVTRDRDRNYRRVFDDALRGARADVMTLSYRSPNPNVFVEWFVPSKIYLRIEARDAAGNLAAFQTREPAEFSPALLTGRLRAVPVTSAGR